MNYEGTAGALHRFVKVPRVLNLTVGVRLLEVPADRAWNAWELRRAPH